MIYLQAKVPLGPLWSGQVEKLAGDKLVWSSDTWTAVPHRTGVKSSATLCTWRKTANTNEKHVTNANMRFGLGSADLNPAGIGLGQGPLPVA